MLLEGIFLQASAEAGSSDEPISPLVLTQLGASMGRWEHFTVKTIPAAEKPSL